MTVRQNNKKPAFQVGKKVRRIVDLGILEGTIVWASKGDANRSEQLIRLDVQAYSDRPVHANQYTEVV